MYALKILVLVVHVSAVALLLGAPLGTARLGRTALQAGGDTLKIAAHDIATRLRLAGIGAMAGLGTGLGLIFLGGGFGAVTKNFHAALGLMLLAIFFNAIWVRPAAAKFKQAGTSSPPALEDAKNALKKLAMGTGILHATWLILLVLMFVRF